MTILEDLEQRKATLAQETQAKLAEIDAAIEAIRRVQRLGFAVIQPQQARQGVTGDRPAQGSSSVDTVPDAGAGPAQRKPAADTPERIQARGEALKDLVLAWLKANGPANTKAIARALGVRIPPVRAALYALESARTIHTVGQKRGQRWHLGPKTPGQTPVPPENRKSEVSSKKPASAPASQAPTDAMEEAIRAARRYGHELGPWKPGSAGAAAGWIARCTGCDTYVTINRTDKKVSGPGTRHECLAKAVGS